MVAFLAILGQFFVQSMLQQQTINAQAIGAATRQQILSWQLREAALALKVEANFGNQKQHLRDIEQVINNWIIADRAFEQAFGHLDVLGVDHGNMQQRIARLKPLQAKILKAARTLMAQEAAASSPAHLVARRSGQGANRLTAIASLRDIRESGKLFSEEINQLILAYNQQAQVGLQQLRLVESGLLGLTLFVLLLEGILIFRPAVEKIRQALSDLAIALQETQLTADKLATEQVRSERLLLNILPAPIADRLKQSQDISTQPQTDAPIADGFSEVTVLFADIVGFTDLSSRLAPETMVGLLNTIFSRFDQLAEQHGLEKIKTIGDAYMVVGGLPKPRVDHASAIAAMALDMQQAIHQFNQTVEYPLEIRMGINTGPVVAGVIGIKKFIYDLWGDTVNIASRMESHGEPGGIQVTAATYQLLQTDYQLESRGAITVKGRGEMETYWLKGRRVATAPSLSGPLPHGTRAFPVLNRSTPN
jgi:adenylate cyclase